MAPSLPMTNWLYYLCLNVADAEMKLSLRKYIFYGMKIDDITLVKEDLDFGNVSSICDAHWLSLFPLNMKHIELDEPPT